MLNLVISRFCFIEYSKEAYETVYIFSRKAALLSWFAEYPLR